MFNESIKKKKKGLNIKGAHTSEHESEQTEKQANFLSCSNLNQRVSIYLLVERASEPAGLRMRSFSRFVPALMCTRLKIRFDCSIYNIFLL